MKLETGMLIHLTPTDPKSWLVEHIGLCSATVRCQVRKQRNFEAEGEPVSFSAPGDSLNISLYSCVTLAGEDET